MKKLFSSISILSLVILNFIPTFAQRTKMDRSQRGQVPFGIQNRRTPPKVVRTKKPTTSFGSVGAVSDGRGVLLSWEMDSEKRNNGFFVFRSDERGEQQISDGFVLGAAFRFKKDEVVLGEKYSFFDPEGMQQSVYYLRSIQADGITTDSQIVSPNYVSNIESFDRLNAIGPTRSYKKNQVVSRDKLVLPDDLQSEVDENQSEPNPANHAWVISQPGVARIGVRKYGMYRVPKAQLQAAGFNVNGDSTQWQLFVDGVEQSIIVGPNGDYIEFLGVGVDSQETDVRTYYLVNGASAGKRISTRPVRPFAATVRSSSYAQKFSQAQRISYLNAILNGDEQNYFGVGITTAGTSNYTFNLSGIDFSSPEATMTVKFQGYSGGQHSIRVSVNNNILPTPTTGEYHELFSGTYTIPTSMLNEGANTLTFLGQASFDFCFFDSVSVDFARKFVPIQDQLNFFTYNYRIANIEGFSSPNIRVFDITWDGSPIQMTNLPIVQTNSTYGFTMPADRGRNLFAVADGSLVAPVSVTANDPSSLKLTTYSADLVIISHKDLLTQSEAWANYRRSQGFTAKVVDVSKIYDEFGFGTLSAESLKAFLEFAKNNWQVPPQYVLIVGDASYDGRNYEGTGNFNMVPTKVVPTFFTETGSDDYLVDFNEDGLTEIPIGRIPARTPIAVTNALAKVTSYEAAAATIQSRGVLFAFDCFDTNNNYNFEAISDNLKQQLNPNVPTTKIGRCLTYSGSTPKAELISAMSTGKYIVNYSGHGSSGNWNSTFFSLTDVPSVTNASSLSLYAMLTCLNGFFNQPTRVSLAETLLDHTNGGAVAAWASSGETTPDQQELMGLRFFSRLSYGSLSRLGDLTKDAKTVIPYGTDVRLSWALIGDPMLKVRTPSSGDRPAIMGKNANPAF